MNLQEMYVTMTVLHAKTRSVDEKHIIFSKVYLVPNVIYTQTGPRF